MRGYDPHDYPPAGVTVDLVVLTIRRGDLAVLLVRRGAEPFLGQLALPGGFVHPDESLDSAASRELREETGLDLAAAQHRRPSAAGIAEPVRTQPGRTQPGRTQPGRTQPGRAEPEHLHLEQLASYGDPGRDPRLHVVTVAYLVLAPELPAPRAGSDAAAASWLPAGGLDQPLAFDHDRILADGLDRARAKLEYTPLATAFCPAEFTVGQLRRVYEIVWGTTLDPRNFHRKVTGTPGFLAPADRTTEGERGRPAQLYRRGDASVLYPPMLRSAVS
jgi:8-oxo-dGTP diphosphatase